MIISNCEKTKIAFLMQFFSYLQKNCHLLSHFFIAFKKNSSDQKWANLQEMKKNDFLN